MEKLGIAQEKVRNLKEELDIVMGEKEKTGKDFNDAVINEINIKKEEKIYLLNNEDYKDISKHVETEQEQNTIKFVKDEEEKENKEDKNEIKIINSNQNSIKDNYEENGEEIKEIEEKKEQKEEEEKKEEKDEEELDEENSNRELIR